MPLTHAVSPYIICGPVQAFAPCLRPAQHCHICNNRYRSISPCALFAQLSPCALQLVGDTVHCNVAEALIRRVTSTVRSYPHADAPFAPFYDGHTVKRILRSVSALLDDSLAGHAPMHSPRRLIYNRLRDFLDSRAPRIAAAADALIRTTDTGKELIAGLKRIEAVASHAVNPRTTRKKPCQLGAVATHKSLGANGRSRVAAGDVLFVCTGSFPLPTGVWAGGCSHCELCIRSALLNWG